MKVRSQHEQSPKISTHNVFPRGILSDYCMLQQRGKKVSQKDGQKAGPERLNFGGIACPHDAQNLARNLVNF